MSFRLKIITAQGTFFDDDIDSLNIKTQQGYVTILPNHISLITPLDIASMTFQKDGVEKMCAIAGGVMHVRKQHTHIITNEIEYREEIDINQAQEQYNMYKRQLEEKHLNLNIAKAEFELRKALNRIQTYGK